MYEDMLNEAIIQSLMDQDAAFNEEYNLNLELPMENDDKILKEVIKMSELEYEKQKGNIDLSFLKRKKEKEKKKDELPFDQWPQESELAKMVNFKNNGLKLLPIGVNLHN